MGIEGVNNNPNLIKMWIDNEKVAEEQYCKDNTDSLIPLFEKELRDLGFVFETSNQAVGFSYTINIQHLLSLVKLLNPRRIHRNVRL